jgi:hypothetical protein
MNDWALDYIYQYIASMRVPSNTLRDGIFRQESYALWAAYEILRRIASHPGIRPIDVVDDFRMEMDRLACLNTHTSWMFSVAYDVADDILYQML